MRIRTVDAFTDRPYAGNPAAVVLWETGPFPEDERLQRLAREMNLSETAYAHPLPEGDGADWALRWFTPVSEVNLCGHATLATAHLLRADGAVAPSGRLRFRTLSGVLSATAAASGETVLDFPTAPLREIAPPAELAGALGAEPVRAYDTGALGDLLVELTDEKAVRDLAPDLGSLAAHTQRAVIVTAAAGGPDGGSGSGGAGGGERGRSGRAPYDYVSRVFAPAVGIPEDPVTGSAHTALAPLWSARLGRDTLTGCQVSARGGYVRTTLRGERTDLAGYAVTVLDAELRPGI